MQSIPTEPSLSLNFCIQFLSHGQAPPFIFLNFPSFGLIPWLLDFEGKNSSNHRDSLTQTIWIFWNNNLFNNLTLFLPVKLTLNFIGYKAVCFFFFVFFKRKDYKGRSFPFLIRMNERMRNLFGTWPLLLLVGNNIYPCAFRPWFFAFIKMVVLKKKNPPFYIMFNCIYKNQIFLNRFKIVITDMPKEYSKIC